MRSSARAVAGDPPHACRLGHRRQRAGLVGLVSLVRLAHHPATSFRRGDGDLARRLAQRARSRAAIPTSGSTGAPARPSPCIPGSWSPSRRYSVVTTLAPGLGMVEGGVDDARLHALGDLGAQRGLADAARPARPRSPSRMPRFSASNGWISSTSSVVPRDVVGAPRLRADIVLREDAAGGQEQREARAGALVGRHVLGDHERPLPRTKPSTCMIGVPSGAASLHGHWIAAELVELRRS